jgi:type II secretory pathway component GspD/PulD (secretin)
MKTKLNQAMNKTCCTLLVSLAGIYYAVAQSEVTNTQPQSVDTPPVAAVEVAVTNAAPAAPAAVIAEAGTNSVVASPLEGTNQIVGVAGEVLPANTNAPVAVGIPQIRFSDVPITTAIENLARLANINYMLDPKIGYGQPDASGQIKAEPTLSIRWENITAENALLALLDNYALQVVHDKKTGISRITQKDPTAPPPLFTKVIQLKYASVSNMIDAAQSVLLDKRSKVLTDPRTSQLVVVATDPEQVAVEALVNQLDKPTRQVLIETRLIQISSNPKTKKGVDWTGTLKNQNVTFGNGKSVGSFTTDFPGVGAPDPAGVSTKTDHSTVGKVNNIVGGGGFSWNTKSGTTPDIGFLNADGLNVVLSFLNESAEAQTMSTPRIVTLDNEEAKISVTRGYPVFSVQAGTQNTAGGSQVSYTNVGTILHVTPRIAANDYIWLRVMPEVSSFFGNFSQSVGTTAEGKANVLTAPIFDTRIVETRVLVPNANTLVIGGLVQDNPRAGYTKVPLLGDIPGLGLLFRSEDKEVSKDNLLIFITPTIVRDSDFQVSRSGEFLKSKPQGMKDPLDAKSNWDSAQPGGNWSDPIPETTR